ncbi:MAG TPA: NADPH-dependent FMN reductase [Croceibacterium sp.]|nr:NADPH-dependent FMN reductase [Croceibacterium sp.]
MSRIAVVVGSLRAESFNRQLAEAMIRLPAAEGHEFAFLEIGDLPLYNQDDDANPPEQAVRLKREIRAADGVMFVTAEYNRSIPGVLKNAIDHASRPYGDSAWAGKPAGVIGVSIGAPGTSMAQQHLRNVLAYLDMPTLGQPEAFIQWQDGLVENGEVGSASRDFLDGWMQGFIRLVETHSG